MTDVMWCENCRMRLGIDVDCDIAGHVHRPIRADQPGTDGWSKDGDDIVTRLRNGAEGMGWSCDFSSEFDLIEEAADEIERLRAAGDALAEYLEGVGHDGPAIVLAVWREASRRG